MDLKQRNLVFLHIDILMSKHIFIVRKELVNLVHRELFFIGTLKLLKNLLDILTEI